MAEQKTEAARATKPPAPLGWYAYLIAIFLFNALIWATPLLSAAGSPLAPPIYAAFSFASHQLDSRSLCYYPLPGHAPIGDCLPQNGALRLERNNTVIYNGVLGYKLPVCARCIGTYGAMLLAGLAWPLLRKPHSRRIPQVGWLVLALLPTAIDGTTQLIGLRESNNMLRLWAGAAMGLGIAFFVIPAFNLVLNRQADEKKPAEKAGLQGKSLETHDGLNCKAADGRCDYGRN